MRRLVRFVARRHNAIQLVSYELSNVALGVAEWLRGRDPVLGPASAEFYTALSFLSGSIAIALFDPERRPGLLMIGSLGLTLGGVCLIFADYPLTGGAVTLASLESARGGLAVLDHGHGHDARLRVRLVRALGWIVLALYVVPVRALCARVARVGALVDERPFVVGTLIKAPLRLEFVVRKGLRGDVVGVVVGLGWLVGDLAIMLNDSRLAERLRAWSQEPSP